MKSFRNAKSLGNLQFVSRTAAGALSLSLLAWLLLCSIPTQISLLAQELPISTGNDAEIPRVIVSGLESSEIRLRLRAQWGGEQEAQWSGRAWLSIGKIKLLKNLCLDPTAPGNKFLDQQQLHFESLAPVAYDGMDFEIVTTEDAILHFEFLNRSQSARDVIEVPVAEILQRGYSQALKGSGQTFSLERTAHDRLQFQFQRRTLVFETGEQTTFDLLPTQTGLPPNQTFDVGITLENVAEGSEQDSLSVEFTSDDRGNLTALKGIEFVVPPVEGAYNLKATVTQQRTGSPFSRPKPILESQVQLIAIDPTPIADPGTPFGEPFEIDPAKPGWWDRLRALPQLRVLPGLSKAAMGNDAVRLVSQKSRNWTELEMGGWVAYPLPLKQVGAPYLIEVEYDTSQVQQLGISIIEPNSAGRFAAMGIDMGIAIHGPLKSNQDLSDGDSTRWFQAVIWPNTDVPLLVLHNLDDSQPARFGRIRVSMGSGRLPAVGNMDQSGEQNELASNAFETNRLNRSTHLTSQFNNPSQNDSSRVPNRIAGAFLDTPLFPDSFSAPESYEPQTDQTHDDWYSFWLGGRRFVEHLRYQGQTAAVLTVLSEGSSLYESDLLQATPKYDSGVFLSREQDQNRKDVLEMLFRIFDRESMTLIPQIELASPLPAIEAELRERARREQDPGDLLLVSDLDVFNRNGIASNHRYNPLSPMVQAAMSDVIKELCDRYGHHPSFGGIAIRFDERTYSHFPNERTGFDFTTVSRYLTSQQTLNGGDDTNRQAVVDYQDYLKVVHERPQEWLEWRQQELTEYYRDLSEIVARKGTGSRLYLSAIDLFRDAGSVRLMHPPIQRARPKPDLERVLLNKGLGLEQLKFTPEITVLSPFRMAPLEPIAASRVERNLESSGELQRRFNLGAASPGSLVYQVTQPHQLKNFADRNPFSQTQKENLLFPQLVGSDAEIRRPYALRLGQQDQLVLMEGGMMAVHGQQRALGPMFNSFSKLPAVLFEDVEVGSELEKRQPPVVVRKKSIDGKTFAYVVNQTPWRLVVDFSLRGDQPLVGQFLDGSALPLIPDRGNPAVLQVTLEPYDLAGMVFDSEAVEFPEIGTSYHNRTQIIESLSKDLDRFQRKLGLAGGNPSPLPVVSNASFEIDGLRGEIPNWESAVGESVAIRRVGRGEAQEGSFAIQMSSNGEQFAWMRSQPIPNPKSGRLSISVWLKLTADGKQPPLRLSVEGRHNGEEYYRFAEVGELAPEDSTQQLGAEWKRFGVHFDDLPPDGLQNLRIGFDLMGAGSVWIDNVQVYELWLDNEEVFALAANRLNLHDALQRGDFVSCLRFLESYWSQILLTHPDSQPQPQARTANNLSLPANTGFSKNLLEQMKSLAPQRVLRLR